MDGVFLLSAVLKRLLEIYWAGRRRAASYRHAVALGYANGLEAFEPAFDSFAFLIVAPAERCFQLGIHDLILFRQY